MPMNGDYNLPFEQTIAYLRALGARARTWVGHNIKFDARFFHQDKIELCGEFEDTVVLARLVDPIRFSASLDALGRDYLPEEHWKDSSGIKEELKVRKSKNYGVVPPYMMGPYCLQDIDTSLRLREVLLDQLPTESSNLWDTEKRLERVLLNSEVRGIYVPLDGLKRYTLKILRQLVPKQDRVNELVGEHVDVLSNPELNRIMDKMGVQPVAYSAKSGNPSWGSDELRSYGTELCDAVADLKEHYARFATYCEGWQRRLDDDNVLHPSFKQYGAKTGRFASEDPNFQNVNIDGKHLVKPRDGYCLLSIDYSQIEFRLFAHYTKSANILGRYKQDPWTDFHGATAEMLGISRRASKTLNFGFIYGMGREKLVNDVTSRIKHALRAVAAEIEDDDKESAKVKAEAEVLLEKLKAFSYGEPVTELNATSISSRIYARYHRTMPEIKQYGRRVEAVVNQRGKLRGHFGRVYTIGPQLAFKGKNWIIQGGAADLLKDRMAGIEPILQPFGAHLLVNVHDEVLIETPLEAYEACARAVIPHLEEPSVPLRVPIKADCAVCFKSWADKLAFKDAERDYELEER